ncbi:MAG TPA: hypothetical protein VHD84_02500 [Candidatus Saccharimonadales bacterium]|nr:hypothetical protein [Candidatus Saccharimonadales bacterium]
MNSIARLKQAHSRQASGDTIVEVLIAIAIAAFAIGISYATAHRSLLQAVTAQERNQALNILENQLSDLKLRYQKTNPDTFTSKFSYTVNHFCLNDSASDPTASNWLPIDNYSQVGDSSTLAAADPPSAGTPYDSGCHQTNGGADYYTDITTSQSSGTSPNPTIYRVIVRWEQLGGGPTNQASIYYRF